MPLSFYLLLTGIELSFPESLKVTLKHQHYAYNLFNYCRFSPLLSVFQIGSVLRKILSYGKHNPFDYLDCSIYLPPLSVSKT